MELIGSFLAMLEFYFQGMTRPILANWVALVPGWLLAERRAITRMMLSADLVGLRHHATFHRIFASAS